MRYFYVYDYSALQCLNKEEALLFQPTDVMKKHGVGAFVAVESSPS